MELAPPIAQELLHCAWWRGPGYGTMLGEALVSEELALHFEILFRGKALLRAAASEAQLLKLQHEARPLFDKIASHHMHHRAPQL